MTLLDSSDLDGIRNTLIARRTQLQDRVTTIDNELHAPLDADWEEAAVQAEDSATLDAQEQLLAAQWAEISAAIARIDTGTYGICIQCKEPISAERLKVRPESTLCIECANHSTLLGGENHAR